jgi:hypothetical protein
MTWQMFRVTYELRSPLHIGYHKIGNLQRTRYYAPARNIWGAVTETLTRRGFGAGALQTDGVAGYAVVGDWVKGHCAFGYWFVCEDEDKWLAPRGAAEGLRYGDLAEYEFERRYLASHVTTALDAATTSAQENSLHEVEFIVPHTSDSTRTQIGGWVFLDETARDTLGDESKWRGWLGDLQVGGERRYGFGQLRLKKFVNETDANWDLDGARPRAKLERDDGLDAHTLAQGVTARGQIEPLVGRETQGDSQRFGMNLTRGRVCWAPGAMLDTGAMFVVNEIGVWVRAE